MGIALSEKLLRKSSFLLVLKIVLVLFEKTKFYFIM